MQALAKARTHPDGEVDNADLLETARLLIGFISNGGLELSKPAEKLLMNLIMATLMRGKVALCVTNEQLWHGYEKEELPPLNMCRRSFFQGKAELIERQFVSAESPDMEGRYWIIPNFCFLLDLANAHTSATYRFRRFYLMTTNGTDKEGPPRTLKEAVERGKRRSELARQRQKEKMLKKDGRLRPITIKYLMATYCKELDLPYFDRWTPKDFRCAKNWINYMEQTGKDPKRWLYLVCELWPVFRRHLRTEMGTRIMVPREVSFPVYFKYRQWMDSMVFDVLYRTEKKEERKSPLAGDAPVATKKSPGRARDDGSVDVVLSQRIMSELGFSLEKADELSRKIVKYAEEHGMNKEDVYDRVKERIRSGVALSVGQQAKNRRKHDLPAAGVANDIGQTDKSLSLQKHSKKGLRRDVGDKERGPEGVGD